MNLTNRVYLAVHVALTLLVCARLDMVPRWPRYLAWNALAIAAILLFTRLKGQGKLWEFVHDWLPAIFFTSVFEEVSLLSLTLRGAWQNPTLDCVGVGAARRATRRMVAVYSSPWFSEPLEFGYASFYPLYPVVGVCFGHGGIDQASLGHSAE